MRNPTLHELLQAFTLEAGLALGREAQAGDGVPFELAESDARGSGRSPLYCYRPLTGSFVPDHVAMLAGLPTHDPVAGALSGIGGLDLYLRARGALRGGPADQEDLAAVLVDFLSRVYHQSTDFGFDQLRFDIAYEELERTIYAGRCVTEIVTALHGIDFDPEIRELPLGDGLAIVRVRALAAAPQELSDHPEQPLLVLRVAHDRGQQPSAGFARARFAQLLTALRLYERGAYSLGPIGYARIDDGIWSPVAVSSPGRRDRLTLVSRDAVEDLRSFCNVIGRRLARGFGSVAAERSGSGEVAWALSRFEMGCDRARPIEGLTDHLLALRALLEPEGPASGRLTQRLAAICAPPAERAELAARVAAAVTLEHSVITGLATSSSTGDQLAEELAEHLRAILRDVLCGHLDADLCAIADELLNEAVEPDVLAA